MSWIERAYVGQKVVSLITFTSQQSGDVGPIANSAYTIREIYADQNFIGFRLVEIVNPSRLHIEGLMESCFWAERFRPIKNTNTQVEALKRICLNTPEVVG